ncbi:guanylate kinase/L-type calcium channel region [Priestia aryabhattai]|uniref:guanylate kinase/L-type calcium channel region n=1 Tax=Priestia aryabhattai TaxID=412384 RepID=UPI002E1D2DF1|nr:guanylate kinase/L-type calcium channel region [Priestia aryabhattai]
MIYVLLGKTCSGKTTVLQALKDLGFDTITTYTTRPQREEEVNGRDYHFVTKRQYDFLDKQGLLTAKNSFVSAHGDEWFYGINLTDIDGDIDSIVITDPIGYRDLVETIGDHRVCGIYLNSSLEVRTLRGMNRKDNANELMRRLQADEEDFKGLEYEVDYIITTVEKQAQLNDVLNIIEGGGGK